MSANEAFFTAHSEQILDLESRFSTYWKRVDRFEIRSWLRQFSLTHRELALKLLQNVDYYDQSRVLNGFRQLHAQLAQLKNGNFDNTYFAPFSPPGKSGDEMLPRYRLASRMRGGRYDNKFIYLSNLPELMERSGLTLAFIDDFVGTGNQAVEIWQNVQGFLTDVEELYLLVLVGYNEGLRNIESNTRLNVITNNILFDDAKVFSPSNKTFTQEEKAIMRNYCERAGSWPEGYGGCQSIVVFYHRAPNNTISILRCHTPTWRGLFPRY